MRCTFESPNGEKWENSRPSILSARVIPCAPLMSSLQASRVTPGLIASYVVRVCLAAVFPTALFAVASSGPGAALWSDLRAWWAPWSDAALFAALITIVHEGLYFGGLGYVGLWSVGTRLGREYLGADCTQVG